MTKRAPLLLMAALAVLALPLRAEVYGTASLANPLDNNGGGARALGLGSAFVGVADDSSALLWNPAGLSGLQGLEVALHHNSWLGGIVQETAVLGLSLGALGGLGASVNMVNYGSLEGYDEIGAATSAYSANRYGLGLGWGVEVLPSLSVGAGLKGAMQSIDTETYTNVNADLGLLWVPAKNLRVGLSYTNLGTTVAGYALNSSLNGGLSYGMNLGSANRLLLAGSGSWDPAGVCRLQAGVEDVINSLLALRLGYQGTLGDTRLIGLSGLTAGMGVKVKQFSLDYAYLPYGDLGAGHRLSLGVQFN